MSILTLTGGAVEVKQQTVKGWRSRLVNDRDTLLATFGRPMPGAVEVVVEAIDATVTEIDRLLTEARR